MQPSMFNTCVPFSDRGEAFLMNTLTDAQMVVSSDVVRLLDRLVGSPDNREDVFSAEEQHTLTELAAHGFVVQDRESERLALERFFRDVREDRNELGVTVLTTLQCNFACSYCFQGDHGVSTSVEKMSLQTADHVAAWIESRLEEVKPESFSLTFFGGEPLLNLPAMYYLAERLWEATQTQGVTMAIHIITNGLLLTPEVVDRLTPVGLSGIKITLDGDRETHDRLRPLRGGQGTFDRIIQNIRRVAGRCRIAIGGNFDEASVHSYPALLDFLKTQDFADSLVHVAFKPIVREKPQPTHNGVLHLTPVDSDGMPLNGTCMSSAGAGGSSPCDACHFVDEQMSFLREETKKRGFPTIDGVHMGPCEIHKRHAYTIGPNGSLYACPGFTGERSYAVGHVDGRQQADLDQAAAKFEDVAAWKQCGDCSFIPVCAGGCSVAAHTELQDMNRPSCHKGSFETALVALAHETVFNL